MSTEEESNDHKNPKMTPQQMLERTKQLYESFVGKSTKIGPNKQEVSFQKSNHKVLVAKI